MSWLTETLAERMQERGLAADAVARGLAIERSRLNNILGGAAVPNENLIKRFATFFGEDPAEWIARAEGRAPAPAADIPAEVPEGFIKMARASEIPVGEMAVVYHDLVVIAHAADGFYAFGNVCPHASGPIGDGYLDGHVVECPFHAGQWDIRSGEALTMLATADIPRFDVRVDGDEVEVRLDDAVASQGVVSR